MILAAVAILFASYIGYESLWGKYTYSHELDNTYMEGCPYPLGGVRCHWTQTGYSGFEIGMSKRQMLAILCAGNDYGEYTPPLRANKKPDFKADSRVGYWEPESFADFPCDAPDRLDPHIRFIFERTTASPELIWHREIFGLVFENGELSLIQVHRSLIYVDL